MKTAHAGMGLSNADFNAVAEDLGASLDAAKVPEREKNDLLAILGKMRRDIVEK
jgi:hemoglobin